MIVSRAPATRDLAATQACAPTGNRTGSPLGHRPVLNPLSYTSWGIFPHFKLLTSPVLFFIPWLPSFLSAPSNLDLPWRTEKLSPVHPKAPYTHDQLTKCSMARESSLLVPRSLLLNPVTLDKSNHVYLTVHSLTYA